MFLSYRRDDAAGHAGRIADHLVARYGPDAVFMDVETIEAGADFVAAIDQAIAGADAALVVIGPGWVQAASAAGGRRLDDPADFVRIEVETALGRGVRTIPVLVGGAPMPGAEELPPSLAPLVRMNGVELVDRRFHADMQALVDALEGRSARAGTGEVHLPAQPTPFVGREDEIAAIRELIGREDVQLLTLTGPGGTGKTRLSIEAVSTLGDRYPDGIWFVGLASLRDPGLVIPTIAATLGVREEGGSTVDEVLGRYLRGRRVLLVLDNLEQLLPDAAAPLARLVEVATGLDVVTSSRVSLGVRAERVVGVSELSTEDALELFVSRATSVAPAFVLDERTRPIVEEICARLEGLPLAIELAAARARALSPRELLDRLSQRLRLLRGGGHDAPERQRTMEAAIAWSHDLLDADERRLFTRLAVFRGGCTLAAAEEVCDADLDAMESLVDKSLLRIEERPVGSTRYRLLETIREFAAERLVANQEELELGRRHTEWCLRLAAEALPGLKGRNLDTWMARLAVEHDNLRSCLRRCLDTGAHDVALELSSLLWLFWDVHGDVTEGRSWLAESLDRAGRSPCEARVLALTGAGWLAGEQGDPSATLLLQQALDAADDASTAMTSTIKTQLMTYVDDPVRARALGDEAIAEARAAGDDWVLAIALNNRADYFRADGDLGRAEGLYEESRTVACEIGDTVQEALCLNNLGEVGLIRGDIDGADRLFAEALALALRNHDERNRYAALLNMGWASLSANRIEDADRSFRESLTILRELGHLPVVTSALMGLAATAATAGNDERAGRLAGAADALVERVGALPTPPDAGVHVPLLTAARDRAGVRWQVYLDEGRAMSLDAAIGYAQT